MATKTLTPAKKAPASKQSSNGKASANGKTAKKNIAASYNQYKMYDGKQYTGMKVGRTHKWYYDKSDWHEKKVTPERWEFTYPAIKRRAGKAPEGSGAPVGTCYHWFILAHQYAEKLNADDYLTTMVGLKFKLAHKRANTDKWNATANTQRKHLIKILQDLIAELEHDPEKSTPIPLNFEYRGKEYKGDGVPVISSCNNGVCMELDITLNQKHLGVLKCTKKGWRITDVSQGLVNTIGDQVFHWYE